MQHAAEQEKTVVLVSLLTACVVSKAILDVAATTIGITAIAGASPRPFSLGYRKEIDMNMEGISYNERKECKKTISISIIIEPIL